MRRSPCLILAIATFSASVALAQTTEAPSPARQACRSSAMELCRTEALSGDRAAVRACLIKNFDKVSPECQTAMKAMRSQIQAAGAKTVDTPPPKP
jgi:hypothetical protein